jgi:hypothetical protein
MHSEGRLKDDTSEFLLGIFVYRRSCCQSRRKRSGRVGLKPQAFICVHVCLSVVILT